MPGSIVPATVFFDLGDTLIFTGPGGVRLRYTDTLDCLQILQARLLVEKRGLPTKLKTSARLPAYRRNCRPRCV